MARIPDTRTWIAVPVAGLVTGVLFSFLIGELDAARYLVEELTFGPFEIPFIVAVALCVLKFGRLAGGVFALFGFIGSGVVFLPGFTTTSLIFLKVAATGMIIPEPWLQEKPFGVRLSAASLPGFFLGCAIGIPLVIHGVSPEVLEDIRKEALGIYTSFMSPDEAKNAADNAMTVMKGLFAVGLALITLNSIALAWLSFLVTGWAARRARIESEKVPSIVTFSLPFHMIWVFLASFALVLTEFKPVFPVALNLCLVTAGLYGFQGLAIVAYHMNRASLGRIPRVLFWLMFFITLAFSGIFLVCVGIIDNWFNLRTAPPGPGVGGNGEEHRHESDTQGRSER
jgi:hypothetical protein